MQKEKKSLGRRSKHHSSLKKLYALHIKERKILPKETTTKDDVEERTSDEGGVNIKQKDRIHIVFVVEEMDMKQKHAKFHMRRLKNKNKKDKDKALE